MTEPDRQPKKTLRQLREEQGWSQVTVGVRLGVAGRTISNWERGLTRPNPDHQQALAVLFGISVADIALGLAKQEYQDRP